ncbi:hypothetical protein CLU79DRAFT_890015 [Phycomyces nitens]|nr:hypothetical protein CLU79DRAFT_890015 [Phycomyces nitens]
MALSPKQPNLSIPTDLLRDIIPPPLSATSPTPQLGASSHSPGHTHQLNLPSYAHAVQNTNTDLDDFLGPLRQAYPRGIERQLKTKFKKTHTKIELCLSSDDYCKQTCREAIVVGDQRFLATPAISADLELFRVNLSGLPADNYDDIAAQLRKYLNPFGDVCETMIYEEGTQLHNGYVYPERPMTSNKVWTPLTYQIKYSDNLQVYGTWAKMGDHCVFCKQMGHSVDDCPGRRKETRTFHNCGITGHIQIHCNRDPPTNCHQKFRMGDDTLSSADFCRILTQMNLHQQSQQAALAKEKALRQTEAEKITVEERATAKKLY